MYAFVGSYNHGDACIVCAASKLVHSLFICLEMDGSVVSTLVLEDTRVLEISDYSLWTKVYAILIVLAFVGLTTIFGDRNFGLLQGEAFAQGMSKQKLDSPLRHNTACRLSMTHYALFDLHCDSIGFRVMDRLVNVGDIGRPFHQQPIPKQTAHITSNLFPLELSPPSPPQNPESEMCSSRLLRWLGPIPRLYSYVRARIGKNRSFAVTAPLVTQTF